MALFKTKQVPPTAINPAPNVNRETPASTNVEKNYSAELKESAVYAGVRIDSEIEKRVVRKLDLHVTPLVTFLCRCCRPYERGN